LTDWKIRVQKNVHYAGVNQFWRFEHAWIKSLKTSNSPLYNMIFRLWRTGRNVTDTGTDWRLAICFTVYSRKRVTRIKFKTVHIWYTGGPKNWHTALYALTLSNIDRFSKLIHCHNQANICNNTVTKDPTTNQVCRTLRCEMSVSLKQQLKIRRILKQHILECVMQQRGGHTEHLM